MANHIARWDGTAWAPLIHDGDPGQNGRIDPVFALSVFDDGAGPALYAGGIFTQAGGVGANRIARWSASQWSPLGVGVDYWVQALTPFDDGGGTDLYVGGWFTHAGGQSANYIAIWTGCPPACPGDLDGDGDVDLTDLATLLSNYGMTSGATYEDGDLDGDEDVDLSDLAALLAVYGTTCD